MEWYEVLVVLGTGAVGAAILAHFLNIHRDRILSRAKQLSEISRVAIEVRKVLYSRELASRVKDGKVDKRLVSLYDELVPLQVAFGNKHSYEYLVVWEVSRSLSFMTDTGWGGYRQVQRERLVEVAQRADRRLYQVFHGAKSHLAIRLGVWHKRFVYKHAESQALWCARESVRSALRRKEHVEVTMLRCAKLAWWNPLVRARFRNLPTFLSHVREELAFMSNYTLSARVRYTDDDSQPWQILGSSWPSMDENISTLAANFPPELCRLSLGTPIAIDQIRGISHSLEDSPQGARRISYVEYGPGAVSYIGMLNALFEYGFLPKEEEPLSLWREDCLAGISDLGGGSYVVRLSPRSARDTRRAEKLVSWFRRVTDKESSRIRQDARLQIRNGLNF